MRVVSLPLALTPEVSNTFPFFGQSIPAAYTFVAQSFLDGEGGHFLETDFADTWTISGQAITLFGAANRRKRRTLEGRGLAFPFRGVAENGRALTLEGCAVPWSLQTLLVSAFCVETDIPGHLGGSCGQEDGETGHLDVSTGQI